MPDNVELVRQIWSAFEQGGVEAVLEITDPDVEWEPYGGGGTVYRGRDGLRAYLQERKDRGERAEGRLYSAVAKGDAVVARGEIRISGEHGMVTMQPGWLYEFRDGKLIRFRGFPTQEAALRAAGLAPEDPTAIVREVWDAFNRRQLDRMFELFADDVEWCPYNGRRALYSGIEGAREYYEEAFGASESANATEYSIRQIGDVVAISGALHVAEANGAIAQRQIHYLFWIDDGKIKRAQSFARREEALAVANASAGRTPG
jgi:ketosteroid isomerase-like protein